MILRSVLGLSCLLAAAAYGAEPVIQFGAIRSQAGAVTPIRWLPAERVTMADSRLLFSVGGTSVRSEPLPLQPLCLYQIGITSRRGPGTRNRFAIVYQDGAGQTHRRQPNWQYPDASRPNWVPLAPVLSDYVSGLILPADTKRVWLELAMEPPDKPELAPYSGWELTRLEFTAGPAVLFGEHLGPNRLAIGDMEIGTAGGQPAGWTDWSQAGNRIQVIEATGGDQSAHAGRRFLRITPGPGFLLGATGVAVRPGTAWRISVWARGKGQLQILTHPLDSIDPNNALRVGDPQAATFPVDATEWTRFEQVWFAESPRVQIGLLVLGVTAAENLELDNVEFRPYIK